MKKALIFGGGVDGNEFPDFCQGDFIIAADKGCEILREYNIIPDITVGDFDSSSFVPENALVLPVEKDITDTHAAVNIALEKGYEEICIFGGMGGRIDHTFANYTLIAHLAQKGKKAYLYGENYTVTAINNGAIRIKGKKGKTVSVFSFSEKCTGVTLEGLHYSLTDEELSNSFALGVSNSFACEEAVISVKKGTLLIMIEN